MRKFLVASIISSAVAIGSIYYLADKALSYKEDLEQLTQQTTPHLENTLCDTLPEELVEINGKRYYSIVEGRPIERGYFPEVKR